MKKRILTTLALTITIGTIYAQQKELLITLPQEQHLDPGYTNIIPTSKGANYEISTMEWPKHYLYTRSEKGKILSVDLTVNSFLTKGKENGMRFIRINKTEKKYGPYKKLYPHYNEKKEKFYGYSYVKDGKNYFEDLVNNKSYGPYDKGGLWYIDQESLVYSYTETNSETNKPDYFLMVNGKKHGPYQQVSYRVPVSPSNPFVIVSKQNGKYSVNLKQCENITFTTPPRLIEQKDGWMVNVSTEDTKDAYKDKWLYLPDGRKLAFQEKLKHIVKYNGEVLRFEFAIKGSNNNNPAWQVSFKGKDIGTFFMKETPGDKPFETDFFQVKLTQLFPDRVNDRAVAQKNVNYLFSTSRGLVGPLTENEITNNFVFPGGQANIKADSTLYVNGKKVLEKVAMFRFDDTQNSWYAFQKRGDYIYPYKEGEEIAPSQLPEKYHGSRYNTADKTVIKVQQGNEYFLRIKGSEKLLGPIGRSNAWVVSDDGKHFAIINGESGYAEVDGKPIAMARGFKIAWNEKMKAFHWLDLDGQKVYMVTYKL